MEWIKISTSTELIKVKTEDIAFVKADGNYSDLYLFNGKPHKVTFKLHVIDETFQRLKNNIFIRVGKSLIVNRNYIYVINITTQANIVFPTSGKRSTPPLSCTRRRQDDSSGESPHGKRLPCRW